jgi:hypothetical protein
MKGSGQTGIEIENVLVKRNGRNDQSHEIMLGKTTDHVLGIMLGGYQDLVIKRGLARGILQAPEECGKGAGDLVVNQAVLTGLIGLEAGLVH